MDFNTDFITNPVPGGSVGGVNPHRCRVKYDETSAAIGIENIADIGVTKDKFPQDVDMFERWNGTSIPRYLWFNDEDTMSDYSSVNSSSGLSTMETTANHSNGFGVGAPTDWSDYGRESLSQSESFSSTLQLRAGHYQGQSDDSFQRRT